MDAPLCSKCQLIGRAPASETTIVTLTAGVWLLIAAVSVLNCGGSSPLNPEAGLPVPLNPGSVIVSVTAQDATPLGGVTVHVTDIPNNVGSTYSVGAATNANGQVSFGSIPAGNRGLDVVIPVGFTAGPQGTSRRVDVRANESVSVGFTLIRQ